MSGIHPSDEGLQQYVLDPAACAPGEIDHIAGCPECQEAAAAYRVLSDALKEQPAPTFDFDLAAAVIVNLKTPPQRKRQGSFGKAFGVLHSLCVDVDRMPRDARCTPMFIYI